MAKKANRSKVRTEFKKNYQQRKRTGDLTRQFNQDTLDEDALDKRERVSGKGEMTRHRTVTGQSLDGTSTDANADIDAADSNLRSGRVLRVHGLESVVRTDSGEEYRCAVRQVLKSISTDQRHIVVAGDMVVFRPEGTSQGIIQSVLPRHGVLSRTSKGRRHVLVSNVDLVIIVASAGEPDIKPHLIDRFLVTAEQAGLEPLIVINKIDLVDPTDFQPLLGVYAQMGYQTLLTSAEQGWGIDCLKSVIRNRQSVVTGQSGVGKSSLLNAIQEGLGLRVQPVSLENSKGKHTTTTSEILPLEAGGYLIDTPGIRQFQLWDVISSEVAGLFRDIRPYVSGCRFPDCTHIHEVDCAVREAVADGRIDPRRYNSYVHLIEDPAASF
ncbi:ribosome small subunit-dependent GTPase A [Aureliella helgolandensis]|uniref:Small ribosomal subunit biogenesis GTPase RsgA n=1 Tax=Aureliella helgolandensis TaxID=2527968 RepID=A0A518GGL6_9BACT|nr:ribosome small subunit-dependent GTPase A [Aureliella helgolandensis]QDV27741.1 Putative ribosome biogenesis GTPase RsgA [Aureliella helgolandensis]